MTPAALTLAEELLGTSPEVLDHARLARFEAFALIAADARRRHAAGDAALLKRYRTAANLEVALETVRMGAGNMLQHGTAEERV